MKGNPPTALSFKQAVVNLIAKQYLPFSIIEEKSFRECLVSFAKENGVEDIKHRFFGRKAVAEEMKRTATEYVSEVIV